ncbi:hypothetical protein PFMALIP_02298 [Plasmodium falciparum MaliPS096_E11]|uniref:Surface antigen n=1 Tax=Plasmodium falciparum MaliPS096_E11 TaxID=1036727 RepID=A0A024WS96_PLAFA|nr:hypothetical protein PFMALIP_02298 [Plasmodium falciparum MaliPS096_E11]
MKIYYINTLLFALPLNILVNNQRNHKSITYHTSNTKKLKPLRSLCECELYAPPNYDNDQEMKDAIKEFNDRCAQRFEEYNERIQDKRKQCKEQCDKDIQKTILKDKIEKELTEKFAILKTKIDTNDIPTCVCEKSMADKVEKTCLKCGGVLGGGVAPELGLIGGTALYGISVWKPKAIASAIAAAKQAGKYAGIKAGNSSDIEAVIKGLYDKFLLKSLGGKPLQDVITTEAFKNPKYISQVVQLEKSTICWKYPIPESHDIFCSLGDKVQDVNFFDKFVEANSKTIVKNATEAAADATSTETARVTTALTTEKTGAIEAACNAYTTVIIASIVAIVVIVLVMIIIYLILRYRRKTKMKKKLQYIKLLNQ